MCKLEVSSTSNLSSVHDHSFDSESPVSTFLRSTLLRPQPCVGGRPTEGTVHSPVTRERRVREGKERTQVDKYDLSRHVTRIRSDPPVTSDFTRHERDLDRLLPHTPHKRRERAVHKKWDYLFRRELESKDGQVPGICDKFTVK